MRELAELVGEAALGVTDRLYLRFDDDVQRRAARPAAGTSCAAWPESLARAWQVLSVLPRRELSMLSPEQLDASWAPSGPAP